MAITQGTTDSGLGDFRICLSLGAGVKHLQCSPQPETKHTMIPGFAVSRQCVFTVQFLPLLAKSSPKLPHIWSFSSQSSFLLLLHLPGFQVHIHDCSHSTSSFSFIVILPDSHLVCICIQEDLAKRSYSFYSAVLKSSQRRHGKIWSLLRLFINIFSFYVKKCISFKEWIFSNRQKQQIGTKQFPHFAIAFWYRIVSTEYKN